MYPKRHRVLALFLSLCAPLFAQQLPTGRIIEGIRCEKDSAYSYLLYLPTDYDASRADSYPVLFVMGSGGGATWGVKRYVRGAGKNNWILAMSKESKNGYAQSHAAIEAMVEDVFDRLHVNEKRCYSTGISGGGREAFWLANKMKNNIVGIIPCGAGDSGNRYNNNALAYGLCGGYCFNRWDMAITFNERIKNDGRLRFFPGGHDWAGEALCFDAITWLNGKYLARKGSPDEVAEFSEMLFTEIQDRQETDPYFAYENLLVLTAVKKAPHTARAKKILTQLKTDPNIELYLEALDDMDDFVDDHFNTDVMDCYNNRCTKRQIRDAHKLSSKYGDTPLAPIIKQFGIPSKEI